MNQQPIFMNSHHRLAGLGDFVQFVEGVSRGIRRTIAHSDCLPIVGISSPDDAMYAKGGTYHLRALGKEAQEAWS